MPDAALFSPLQVRGTTLKNRIVVSPMCQYSCIDGLANDWHLVHLGSRAVGGAALVFTEACAVSAQGRISPSDLGLWNDQQIAPLERITSFIHRMGAIAGIQLAHAGRKASCLPPWQDRGRYITEAEGGWPIVAPSPVPFNVDDPVPQELDQMAIKEIIAAFVASAHRAIKAGFTIIEVHAAHGYLLHSFLSPLSNKRTDIYGGSLENRMRIMIELTIELRKSIPLNMPLFVRISATDWADGGWDIEQSVVLAKRLKDIDVDLIDVSSGGTLPNATIPVGPGYQVPFSAKIKLESGIMTSAVGLITEANQANEIITSKSADLIFLARQMLRDPYFAAHAALALGQTPEWPIQYGRVK